MPAPSIALSPSEAPAFAHLWRLADPSNSGLISGADAVRFFGPARLPAATLSEIWTLADRDQNGFLTPPAFSVALRLVGHAQRGQSVSAALIDQPGPPPQFEGIPLPQSAPAVAAAPAAPPLPPLTADDRARYSRIFASAAPPGALLEGDKARDIFVKSNLPWDKLGAIWTLADTRARGALDLTDFTLGMYFIQHTMNGDLRSLPSTLPPGLYEQAAGGVSHPAPPFALGSVFGDTRSSSPLPLTTQHTGASAGYGRTPSVVARQMTGVSAQHTGIAPQYTGVRPQTTGLSAQHTGQASFRSPSVVPPASAVAWDVSAAEKARTDRFFDQLDTGKTGALEGAAVVPFLMQSKLDETTLAHVWDLADITATGSLSRDEFAVAMYLINHKLGGQDVPATLPVSLVPPSLRNVSVPASDSANDTQRDLFSLMDDDVPLPQPPIRADSAFRPPSNLAGNAIVASPRVASPAIASPVTGAHRSVDANGFENSFSPRVSSPTASAAPSASAAAVTTATANPAQSENIFDVAASAMGPGRYGEVQAELETERKLVRELERKSKAQTDEVKAVRAELIHEESTLSALQASKDELEQQLLRDREETRALRSRVGEVEVQTKALQVEVEKVRKDARHQKGLYAIAQKQLATAEAEFERLTEELDLLKNPVSDPAAQEAGAPTRDSGDGTAGAAATAAAGTAAAMPAAYALKAAPSRGNNPFGLPSEVPPVSPAALAPATAASGFDDAFGSFDAPATVSAPAAPVLPAQASTAGFDDAFASFAPAPKAAPAPPSAHIAAEEIDSSDDDEGPEDLDNPRHLNRPAENITRRAPPAVPARGPALQAPARTGSAIDDFDSAFASFSPPAPVAAPTVPVGTDPFEPDFNFAPSFAPAHASSAAAPASTGNKGPDFFGFDDAFGAPAPAPAPAPASDHTAPASVPTADAFGDAFGEPTSAPDRAPASASAPVPALAAAPDPLVPTASATDAAQPDDARPVKQLTAMGFPRTKVLAALEASNYRVDRALERLLASA